MKEQIKRALLGSAPINLAYSKAHELRFERDYRRRRERYNRAAQQDPDAYSVEDAVRRAKTAISKRGYQTTRRARGSVHTFAFVPSHWSHQNQIVAALDQVGPVSRFAYDRSGFPLPSLKTHAPGSPRRRREMLDLMLSRLRNAHQQRPVDWFFSYSIGWDFSAELIQQIKTEFGFPMVNISLDDKNWWDEIEPGDSASGLINIAPHFDLGWTSATLALPWYRAEGGQAVFLPEGVNTEWFRPLEVAQDLPVSFVGSKFGYRAAIIERLRRIGIDVTTRGPSWPGGALSDEDMLAFFNRSLINLGLGDMHYSRVLTNLKGRDFEVPATGRGVYLTAFNSELARCFEIGREILCYRGEDELVELLRYQLRNPKESAQMAARARARCIREHQWVHRIWQLLRWLGIVAPDAAWSTTDDPAFI